MTNNIYYENPVAIGQCSLCYDNTVHTYSGRGGVQLRQLFYFKAVDVNNKKLGTVCNKCIKINKLLKEITV